MIRIRRKFAFTLAEVLITLSIIGVVAVLTIPSLLANYEQQANYTRLKKYQTNLANVYQLVVRENGTIDTWNLVDNNHNGTVEIVADYFLPHLKSQKNCINAEGCWVSAITKNLSKSAMPYTDKKGIGTNTVSVKMPDGVNISINSVDAYEYPMYYGVKNDLKTNFGIIFWVDVNGDKLPNTVGLDTFAFVVRQSGLVPAGIDNDSNCNRKSADGYAGTACTYRVLREQGIKY